MNLQGFIPLKQFCYEQAALKNVSPTAIWYRIYRGKYPTLVLKHINRRLVLVRLIEQHDEIPPYPESL